MGTIRDFSDHISVHFGSIFFFSNCLKLANGTYLTDSLTVENGFILVIVGSSYNMVLIQCITAIPLSDDRTGVICHLIRSIGFIVQSNEL